VNDTLVRQHNIMGTIFGTPRDDRIFVTNTANSTSTIIIPGGRPAGLARAASRVSAFSFTQLGRVAMMKEKLLHVVTSQTIS
jgi:hypothetical protein